MAGHNKWSKIKRLKSVNDARKGKIFTKLIREITIASRIGGSSIDGNHRLKSALVMARSQNMPQENIERAIKKGAGELEGQNLVESTYEGYGPCAVAILVDVVTDNKTRTAADIRHLFAKNHGHFGEPGSVAWNFEHVGLFSLDKSKVDESTLMEETLTLGAKDIHETDSHFDITCEIKDFYALKNYLEGKSYVLDFAQITQKPKNLIKVNGDDAMAVLKLIDALEDNDDVQRVYTNADIDESIMEKMAN